MLAIISLSVHSKLTLHKYSKWDYIGTILPDNVPMLLIEHFTVLFDTQILLGSHLLKEVLSSRFVSKTKRKKYKKKESITP